jgi:nucleotide-binding universal stress UspA family protein
MIPNIQKILYATDLSPNSVYALRYAINSAIKHDADIIILHVFEKVDPAGNAWIEPYLYEKRHREILDQHVAETKALIINRLNEIRENELRELKNTPEYGDMKISIEICEGFPAEEILSMAEAQDCDEIIMGTHSKGIIANTFLGSTAKRVLRRTRKPVFIVPLPKEETDIAFPAS